MLSYALVVARPGAVISRSVLELLSDPSPTQLPFRSSEHTIWSDPTGSVVVAGWGTDVDATGGGAGWHQSKAGLTAFTGYLWPRGGAWWTAPSWAEQLEGYLRQHPLRDGTDGLLGRFTAVSLDREGRGVLAADPLGFCLNYWGENTEISVVSSRASLAAQLLVDDCQPRRDPLGTGWLAYTGWVAIGGATGFEGVEALSQGESVDIDPDRGARRRAPTSVPWRFAAPPDVGHHELVDGIRSDIATSVRGALSMPVGRRICNITGGKDSRLILAILLEEGIADQFEFETLGAPDLPDVVIGKRIAASFGLTHRVGPDEVAKTAMFDRIAALVDLGPDGASQRELVLRTNAGSWSAMRSGWNPMVAFPPNGDRVVLVGVYGEPLRTNYPRAGRLRTGAQLEEFLRNGWKYGTSGILRDDLKDHYERELVRFAHEGETGDDAPPDVVDSYHLRHQIRRWIGTTEEIGGQNSVFPLYSTFGVRTAFEMDPADRHCEVIHFEIISRASDRLAQLPFADNGWSERVVKPQRSTILPPRNPSRRTSPEESPDRTQRQLRPKRAARRSVRIDRQKQLEPTDVDIMRRFLLDEPSNPVFDVLDRKAVATALDGFGELTMPARKQMYGALTAAIWLGRHEFTPAESSVAERRE